MRYFIPLIFCAAIIGCAMKNTTSTTASSKSNEKVEALLAKMTMEEKVGQMTQLNIDVVCEGDIYNLVEPNHIDSAKLHKAIVQYHVGSILNCGGHAYPREQWLEIIGTIQRYATTKSRLKIPVIYGIDAIHGANYVIGSTLFPQPIAQAATFNRSLVKEGAAITAYETRSAGQVWNFSPVLDVARNPLWSRVFETYGEDPYVCSELGSAAILGYQGEQTFGSNNVAACMKHFLGYSGTNTGKDRTPAFIPNNTLREIYLPPFKKAIEAGAKTVMINSGEINGIPVHASYDILTTLLREELKFQGIAVTDWEDIMKLQDNHHVAKDLKEATYMAIQAGIDMCMVPNDYRFSDLLIELVKEGRISEDRLNLSVRRILQIKDELGLLDNTLVPTLAEYPLFGSKEHRTAALETAEESITLLENRNGMLPLTASQKVFVTGAASNDMRILNGAWTRTWQGVDPKYDDASMNTIVEAMRLNSSNISFDEGYNLFNKTFSDKALEEASKADVIVVCVGEMPCTEKPGDIHDLTLDKEQVEYVKALSTLRKKMVLVLVENRPRVINEIADLADAVVMAYLPGDFGGEAIASVLYGKVNPSGKLPYTYPRYPNDLMHYDHKYTEQFSFDFKLNAFNPQWELGRGLSYSEIEYGDIQLDKMEYAMNEDINVSIEVRNNSMRSAKETVIVFQSDLVAEVTPAVKKLVRFEKYKLNPNEKKVVTFTIPVSDLKYYHPKKEWTLEPGEHVISIGDKKASIKIK